MQTRSRLLHDLTRVAGGALSSAVGVKDEMEALLRHRLERLVQTLDLAASEDLEAVRAVAIRAREEQERLTERVAALERKLEALAAAPAGANRGGAASGTPRKSPKPRAAKRKTAAKRTPARESRP